MEISFIRHGKSQCIEIDQLQFVRLKTGLINMAFRILK